MLRLPGARRIGAAVALGTPVTMLDITREDLTTDTGGPIGRPKEYLVAIRAVLPMAPELAAVEHHARIEGVCQAL